MIARSLYPGLDVYARPGLYLKFYGITTLGSTQSYAATGLLPEYASVTWASGRMPPVSW